MNEVFGEDKDEWDGDHSEEEGECDEGEEAESVAKHAILKLHFCLHLR